jgi:hypothetical protein
MTGQRYRRTRQLRPSGGSSDRSREKGAGAADRPGETLDEPKRATSIGLKTGQRETGKLPRRQNQTRAKTWCEKSRYEREEGK